MGIQTEGRLFEAVQVGRVFRDSKTFVDATPLISEQIIAERFQALEEFGQPFDLRAFVDEHFRLRLAAPMRRSEAASADAFVELGWDSLTQTHAEYVPGSTLSPLPFPYVVPGGRFEELFYWDSYFTGLGLLRQGHVDLFKGMVDNLIILQEQFGHIPNGSRTYLTSRSQPPLLAAMVSALGEAGVEIKTYLPALLREHTYWTSGERVVTAFDVSLSRYWDDLATPRPEAFAEDLEAAKRSGNSETFRHLRAGAASGWDFSSRWCGDPLDLSTIETTNIIPVDLNALLVQLELTIADVHRSLGHVSAAARWEEAAEARARAVRELFWNATACWFCDLDLVLGHRPSLSLAGMVPLALLVATPEQATKARTTLLDRFLAPGGLRTTETNSGQQWDAPNGWAPLQWWSVVGLRAYGFVDHGFLDDAKMIADRWLTTCRQRFLVDGTLLEKYDVEVPVRRPSGGEYEVQEGFGWTNGVLADLAVLTAT